MWDQQQSCHKFRSLTTSRYGGRSSYTLCLTCTLTSLQLFSNPTLKDLYRYEQAGCVAAYEHCAMVRLHYQVADALDDCLARMDAQEPDLLGSGLEGLSGNGKERAQAHARLLRIYATSNSETNSEVTVSEDEDDSPRV